MDPQMMADALRRQEAAATLAQITGDPVLGRLGEGMQRQVQKRREGLRAAEEARRKFESARPSGVPGFVLRAGQVEPMPGYEEHLQRQHEREKELMGLRAARQDQPSWMEKEIFKRSMGTPTQVAAARETETMLPRLLENAISLGDQDIPAFTESAANYIRNMPLGESVAPAIERYGMTPEQISWLETGRQMEQDIMRLASGLAVTEFELANLKKWSPWASNITNAQRRNRLRNIYNKMGAGSRAVQGPFIAEPWQNAPESVFMPQQPTLSAPEGVAPEEWGKLDADEQAAYLKMIGAP